MCKVFFGVFFCNLWFLHKYFSILNTIQAEKWKALKVTIPDDARLPSSRYISFTARSGACGNTKKKRLISFIFLGNIIVYDEELKKKYIDLWNQTTSDIKKYAFKNFIDISCQLLFVVWTKEFGRKFECLTVWKVLRRFHLCEQHIYQIFLSNFLIKDSWRWCWWWFKCQHWSFLLCQCVSFNAIHIVYDIETWYAALPQRIIFIPI